MWHIVAGRLVRIGLAVLVLAAGLGIAALSGVSAQTVADVEERDRLIADQEALLNVYRCMFNVDTQVVPGGCSNGAPGSPAQQPGQFSGTPTAQDITVRDQLIANQEALLNVYRCQFNIDTELVPNGCQESAIDSDPTDPTAEPPNLGPIPHNEFGEEYFGWVSFARECGAVVESCNNPEDTQTLIQGLGNLLGCEIDLNTLRCAGIGDFAMDRIISSRSCPEGWFLDLLEAARIGADLRKRSLGCRRQQRLDLLICWATSRLKRN